MRGKSAIWKRFLLLHNCPQRIWLFEHNLLSCKTCRYSEAHRQFFSLKLNWNSFNTLRIWWRWKLWQIHSNLLKIQTLQPKQLGKICTSFWPFKIVLEDWTVCTMSFNWQDAFSQLVLQINFNFHKRSFCFNFLLMNNLELIFNLTEIFKRITKFFL